MKVKCEYCDSYIDDTLESCPFCGAPNEHMTRSANGVPKTIEELKAFCAAKNMPLEKMRFFIGENYTGPKAFGIYKEGDLCTVYKNKADGTRAVRYHGPDEAYAVNEIYQKMKAEVLDHRVTERTVAPTPTPTKKKGCSWKTILIILAIFFVLVIIGEACSGPASGYYNYNGATYYNQGGSWYGYSGGAWSLLDSVDSGLSENYDDYYSGSDSGGLGDNSFENSDWWDDSDDGYDWDDDSDWGSDNDWDSGFDWDSGGDWDSDW